MSDWKPINPNFYTAPGGLGTYGLLYNNKTGDYQIKQKSVLNEFSSPGLPILYQNGVWYSDALRIPDLFTYAQNDIVQANPIPTSNSLQLNLTAKSLVNKAYGGPNTGNKVNASATTPNLNAPATTANSAPGSNPDIAGKVAPGLANAPGEGSVWDLLNGGISPVDFPATPNPAATGSGSLLYYPIDLIRQSQDILEITQVEYQSPNKDIFSGSADILKILNEGIQRGSVNKSIKGRVILPMPNNPNDSNNVAWGEDSMDALTTAAAASVVNKPRDYGAGALASAVAGGIAGAAGLGGLSDLLKNGPAAAMRLDLLRQISDPQKNQNVKAALYSLILSKYGFEVTPESILSRGLGVVPNSNMQLLFNNVTLRSFNFSYMMSPRSKEEANMVNMILRFFKQGMAAKKKTLQAGGASLYLGTPNVFKLEYKSGGQAIPGVNKFKICALTGFGVNYAGAGQWAAYDGGQPATVVMTMGFREIEPVYENDYQSTSGDISFDLPPVSANDVGY
jgi:hypothetical protein